MRKGRKQPPPPSASAESKNPKPAPLFELRYTLDAGNEIKNLDGSIRQQLKKVLERKVAVNPEGYGSPLHGVLTNYWKHEFADHRVIYRIYPDQRFVVVCAVGSRKQGDTEDIYRQLESVAKTGKLAGQVAAVLQALLPTKK